LAHTIALGPENRGEDRFVVFVTVHPANVASYDGYSAVEEIQFPLHMAMRANTSELKQKFVDLLLVRFRICKHADPLALQRLPSPLYTKILKLLKESTSIVSKLSRAITVTNSRVVVLFIE
jgi:hypothetical protein